MHSARVVCNVFVSEYVYASKVEYHQIGIESLKRNMKSPPVRLLLRVNISSGGNNEWK